MSDNLFDPKLREQINFFDRVIQKIKALNTAGQVFLSMRTREAKAAGSAAQSGPSKS